MTVEEALDHIALYNSAFIESHDIVEATTAFFEKRPPKFTGEPLGPTRVQHLSMHV